MSKGRDHGGGLDAAIARWGGTRADWLDLSTGINPVPYPLPPLPADAWTALPDRAALERLETAARKFWNVPDDVAMLAANGASALIAAMPALAGGQPAYIPTPTYNEHAAAFAAAGIGASATPEAAVHVYVHPNNPDGRFAPATRGRSLTVLDESFCDVTPDQSRMSEAGRNGVVVLKSFGKFWGLAGVRLGFAFGSASQIETLRDRLGPWAVSGPALEIGAAALEDSAWADRTRIRLGADAARLDGLVTAKGATCVGGTPLFRLYDVPDAADWQSRLAERHIWSRIFPYSSRWLRLGLPRPDGWSQLESAL